MPNKTSIADCNSGWILIEPGGPLQPGAPFEIGVNLRQLDTRRRYVPSNRSAEVKYYQLEDVIFDGQTGALFKDLAHISETRYSTPDSHQFQVDPRRVVRIDDARTVFVGFHAWHNNYYHWVTQCVPSIYWGRRTNDASSTIFALPRLAAWQEEALCLAGLDGIERHEIDHLHQYDVGRLAYTTVTQGATTYRPSQACLEVFRTMRSNAQVKTKGAKAVIYVSRSDVTTRRMLNEPELCERLAEQGVQIVVPGSHTVAEQIAIFASAGLIIGPHGAGLTNVVFSEPGVSLYEITSGGNLNPCYANLAQLTGANYHSEAFSGDTLKPANDEWTVDIAGILQTTRKLADGMSSGS
jgi:capsular polysaccharide biosynthesis protein